MSITKTKNNSYRVRKKYPVDVVQLLGLSNPDYDKIFKTQKEAKKAELDFENRVQQLRETQNISSFELGGEVLFKDFYQDTWLDDYKSGLTSSYPTPPSNVTVSNTMDVFRLHILPMFGDYTLNFLNHNRKFVIQKMNAKAKEYANFKVIRSYVTQVFDLAEEYEYIEHNRLSKSLKKIKAVKKIHLKETKRAEDQFLSESQLLEWFQAVQTDYDNQDLTQQDYALFWTTYFLSDRKSETYALQWKHINFTSNKIHLVQALDKFGNVKSTKGNKSTDLTLPVKLKSILLNWKEAQKKELTQFNIKQNRDQFLFTFIDRKGNINQRVHTDFLNYRMKSIKRRHPNLAHCTPHKLRHTTATLAKLHGMSLESISEALTHSEVGTTKTYINANNVIKLTPADFTYNQLLKSSGGE